MDFKDKVVWITGASSGIGEALAYAFNREGARLVLSSRHADALERVRQNCGRNAEEIMVLPLDLADLESLPQKADQAVAACGRIDILVNNGGIGQHSLAVETSLAVDQAIMLTNYMGHVALTKAVLPAMIQRNAGHIVVVSSVTGKFGVPMRSAYSASKHALHGFFESLRAEIWRDQIKITLVCPGFVRTKIRKNALQGDGKPRGGAAAPYRGAISAEECAAEILKAIANGKEEAYIGRQAFAVYAYRFFPGLFSWALRRMKDF